MAMGMPLNNAVAAATESAAAPIIPVFRPDVGVHGGGGWNGDGSSVVAVEVGRRDGDSGVVLIDVVVRASLGA